ncbi:MAG: hypothetical protein R3B84_09315 [Zavarzinella sp.]
MIRFQCWCCHRNFLVSEDRIGETIRCGCEHTIRVPKRNNGNSKCFNLLDFVIERGVYGFGSGLLVFLIGMLVISKIPVGPKLTRFLILGVIVLLAVIFGAAFGERGINWIGGKIRNYEDR